MGQDLAKSFFGCETNCLPWSNALRAMGTAGCALRSSVRWKAGGLISTCWWKARVELWFFICLLAWLIHSLRNSAAPCLCKVPAQKPTHPSESKSEFLVTLQTEWTPKERWITVACEKLSPSKKPAVGNSQQGQQVLQVWNSRNGGLQTCNKVQCSANTHGWEHWGHPERSESPHCDGAALGCCPAHRQRCWCPSRRALSCQRD